jgi:hypothetical protein
MRDAQKYGFVSMAIWSQLKRISASELRRFALGVRGGAVGEENNLIQTAMNSRGLSDEQMPEMNRVKGSAHQTDFAFCWCARKHQGALYRSHLMPRNEAATKTKFN